jgi:hypothetical protein
MKLYLQNIAIFLTLVLVGDLVYFEMIGHKKNPWEIVAFDALLEEGVDVIYFGDSTTIDISKNDQDLRPLPEMVNDASPGFSVRKHSYAAYHAEVFEGYCRRLATFEQKPKAVIIPINMRSLSPAWDLKPEWQFEKEKFLLKNNRYWADVALVPLTVFRYVDLVPIEQDEFETEPVYFGKAHAGHIAEFIREIPDETEVDHFWKQFVFGYGYPLSEGNRKLRALLQSAKLLNEAEVVPIFYIAPLDFTAGGKWAGEKFTEQLDVNVAFVVDIFERMGVDVLDLSRTISSESFDYEWDIHEHLDEDGRGFVAEKLADKIKQTLSSEMNQ